MTPWTEYRIAGLLSREVFQRKCVVVVPNCNWPGSETDVLCVTRDLRVIDVEIKISRADLRADQGKDKWFHPWRYADHGPERSARPRREWPNRVWKHYYCVPAEIWRADLMDHVGAVSGVITITESGRDGYPPVLRVERKARPNRDAPVLTPAQAVDIARLASLRMWDAYAALDRARADASRLAALRAAA